MASEIDLRQKCLERIGELRNSISVERDYSEQRKDMVTPTGYGKFADPLYDALFTIILPHVNWRERCPACTDSDVANFPCHILRQIAKDLGITQ